MVTAIKKQAYKPKSRLYTPLTVVLISRVALLTHTSKPSTKRKQGVVIQTAFGVATLIFLLAVFFPSRKREPATPPASSGANFGGEHPTQPADGNSARSAEEPKRNTDTPKVHATVPSPRSVPLVEARPPTSSLLDQPEEREIGPVIQGFFVGMSWTEAQKLLKEKLGTDCQVKGRPSNVRKDTHIFQFLSPSVSAGTPDRELERNNNHFYVDDLSSKVVGFSFTGKTFDKIFDSQSLDAKEFAEQFMHRYNIPRMEVDVSKSEYPSYTYSDGDVKISIGFSSLFGERYKILDVNKIPKATF